jgi:hypothetical protein
LYSPVETLPVLQNAASRLVVVWNSRGMSSQLNLEKVRRITGKIFTSEDLACYRHQSGWCVEWEGP